MTAALNTGTKTGKKKSGLADSPFFAEPPTKKGSVTSPPDEPQTDEVVEKFKGSQEDKSRGKRSGSDDTETPQDRDTVIPQHHDTTTPRDHDATTPRHHDALTPGDHDTIIEPIRREVKRFGKEAATHRFTLQEKRAIAELIYAFKKRGLKTTENEIARIAINFILIDYEENKAESVLERTLKALDE